MMPAVATRVSICPHLARTALAAASHSSYFRTSHFMPIRRSPSHPSAFSPEMAASSASWEKSEKATFAPSHSSRLAAASATSPAPVISTTLS